MNTSEFYEDVYGEDIPGDDEYVDLSEYPSVYVTLEEIQYGIFVDEMVVRCGFAKDISCAVNLIEDGLIYVNDEEVPSADCILTEEDFYEGYVVVEKCPEEYCSVLIDL